MVGQLSPVARLLVAVSIAFIMIVLYLICAKVYDVTYVWQMTTLGQFIEPVQRQKCEVPIAEGIGNQSTHNYI
jgi:hypothetical protein